MNHHQTTFRVCKTCSKDKPLSDFPFFNGKKWQGFKRHCFECAALAQKKRRAERPPEQAKAIRRQQYLRGQKTELAYAEARRASGVQTEYQRKWREKNPDYFKQYFEQLYAKYPFRARAYANNRRNRIKGNGGSYSEADVIAIRDRQSDRCAVCQIDLKGCGEVDHIVALYRGGDSSPDNLQLLCTPCNRSKGTSDFANFLKRLRRRNA